MASRFDRAQRIAPVAQLVGAAFVLLLTIAAPPPRGAMLIMPIVPAATAHTINWALAQDASLLGDGPWRGAVVVRGDRAKLAGAALRHGALLFGVPATFCGAPSVA